MIPKSPDPIEVVLTNRFDTLIIQVNSSFSFDDTLEIVIESLKSNKFYNSVSQIYSEFEIIYITVPINDDVYAYIHFLNHILNNSSSAMEIIKRNLLLNEKKVRELGYDDGLIEAIYEAFKQYTTVNLLFIDLIAYHNELVNKFSHKQLISAATGHSGIKCLRMLLEFKPRWDDFRSKEIMTIVENGGGEEKLRFLADNYFMFSVAGVRAKDLVTICRYSQVGGCLLNLLVHHCLLNLSTLQLNEDSLQHKGFTVTQIVKIAKHQGSSSTLECLSKTSIYTKLIDLGFSHTNIVKLASTNYAKDILLNITQQNAICETLFLLYNKEDFSRMIGHADGLVNFKILFHFSSLLTLENRFKVMSFLTKKSSKIHNKNFDAFMKFIGIDFVDLEQEDVVIKKPSKRPREINEKGNSPQFQPHLNVDAPIFSVGDALSVFLKGNTTQTRFQLSKQTVSKLQRNDDPIEANLQESPNLMPAETLSISSQSKFLAALDNFDIGRSAGFGFFPFHLNYHPEIHLDEDKSPVEQIITPTSG